VKEKNDIVVVKDFSPPTEPGVHHRLLCMTGENKGVAYYLKKNRTIMGRGDSVDIFVADQKASREHVELIVSSAGCIATDLGSHNGIVINDEKTKQRQLADNDRLIIGHTVYRYNTYNVASPDEDETTGSKKDKYKHTKKFIFVIILGVVVTLALLNDEKQVGEEKKIRTTREAVSNVTDEVTKKLEIEGIREANEEKEKLDNIFMRGLREYREGNYYRAYKEFNDAKRVGGDSARASFYLNRTNDAINKYIESLFVKAARDVDSLKFDSAKDSYCTILRFISENVKDDSGNQIEKRVRDAITNMEKAMSVPSGTVQCSEQDRGVGLDTDDDEG